MAREIQDFVREHLEAEEEHDRQWREAHEAEEAGQVQENPSPTPFRIILDLSDMPSPDEVEQYVDRYHENRNVATAWLAKEAELNRMRATLDQREAKIEQLEVKVDELTAWNTGLRNENEFLRNLLGER